MLLLCFLSPTPLAAIHGVANWEVRIRKRNFGVDPCIAPKFAAVVP
jgi:hypothetical protein